MTRVGRRRQRRSRERKLQEAARSTSTDTSSCTTRRATLQILAGGRPPSAPSPSTLTADKAQIDGAAKVYKAIGNVHYVQADTVVDADTGTLDDAAHTLLLGGTVHIAQGTRNMTARSVALQHRHRKAHAEGDVTMQFPGECTARSRRRAAPHPEESGHAAGLRAPLRTPSRAAT